MCELLDTAKVADLLGCSKRHVARMRQAGKMPAPVWLGALVRWDRDVIRRWIADGCPECGDRRGGQEEDSPCRD